MVSSTEPLALLDRHGRSDFRSRARSVLDLYALRRDSFALITEPDCNEELATDPRERCGPCALAIVAGQMSKRIRARSRMRLSPLAGKSDGGARM